MFDIGNSHDDNRMYIDDPDDTTRRVQTEMTEHKYYVNTLRSPWDWPQWEGNVV